MKKSLSFIALAVLSTITIQANAAILITEVTPWASNNGTGYLADWFELTNTGSTAVNISGWTMDDDSGNPNSALLAGINSINANESVVFLELAGGGNATTLKNNFINTWFNGVLPSGLQIGTYTQGVAGGVGLSATADAVNIYNGVAGTLQARVTFGASDASSPFQTFNNAAGLNNAAISTLSVVGVNGAFTALNSATQVGSPGRIAAPVPEADSYAMLLAGLGFMGFISRRRKG